MGWGFNPGIPGAGDTELATEVNQINGDQKTQIVGPDGEPANVVDGKLDVNATFGGTVNSAPTFKEDPTNTLEEPKYGIVDEEGYQLNEGRFARIAKAIPKIGEELRFDDIAAGDLYIGAALAGSSESTGEFWDVVRYTRTSLGKITRLQFQAGINWSDRTSGW